MKNNKTNQIFIGIIIIEIILIGILYLFFQNPCGSACNTQSLLNPFGINEPETCIMLCEKTQNNLFYPLLDLTIITIIIYILFLFKIKMKGGYKK